MDVARVRKVCVSASLALLLIEGLGGVPQVSADELVLNAGDLARRSVSRDLEWNAKRDALVLQRGRLYEDDGPAAGYSYKPNVEKLSPGHLARKQLEIADPRADAAWLIVGSRDKLEATVNGEAIDTSTPGREGLYWTSTRFAPDTLKPGLNSFVLHGTGSLWIARDDEFAAGSTSRTHHPNRSARSTDGGRTWDDTRLGTDRDIDGEYYVRVYLDHYRPEGTLVLPVVDAGNLAGRAIAPPLKDLPALNVSVVADEMDGTSFALAARSGRTSSPDADWSEWTTLPAENGARFAPAGRFVQLRVTLATRDPRRTPSLREVRIAAAPETADDWSRSLSVVEFRNPEILRTSIPFEYEPLDHPKLKQFREKHRLDDVVAGAKSEWDLVGRLAVWSAQCWKRGHLKDGYPAWDALEILKRHADGTPTGGFCQQYNLVFLQACESFGLIGRAVSLGPGSLMDKPRRGGHEVVEIWSNEFAKWIYIDGQFAWYAVDGETGSPLSLREVRDRQLDLLEGKSPARTTRVVKLGDDIPRNEEWTQLDQGIPFAELRMIPRSNFLEQSSPLPLNQGMRGWFWTGHSVWADGRIPRTRLYDHFVALPANWDWTLNQAHVTLEASAMPGSLRVHLDTVTPSFETFVLDVENETVKTNAAVYEWRLKPGRNRLTANLQNTAGRAGIPATMTVDYQP